MRQVIKLTESDLHKIIKESVNKILREGWNSNLSPDALDDKAYMNDLWAEREKMMQDDWERRNIAIRKKYPGKSCEWYEAMLDTFYENKANNKRTINEDEYSDGEGDKPALISIHTIDAYNAQEIAEDYGLESTDEGAAEWFKGVVESDADFEEDTMPKYADFKMEIPELRASMYYDWYGEIYFLAKEDEPSQAPMTIENKVSRVVRESLRRLIETDCAGVMQTGCGNAPKGTNPEAGQYTVPFGPDKETSDRTPGFSVKGKAVGKSDVQRRQIYNPKSGK